MNDRYSGAPLHYSFRERSPERGGWRLPGVADLHRFDDWIIVLELVVLIVVLGVFPKPMLDVIEPAVQSAMQHVGVTDPQPKVSAEGGR